MFADGSMYEGEWKDGAYNGAGTLVHKDGRTYNGSFVNGSAHGTGQEVDATGRVIHQGKWIDGQPETKQRGDISSRSKSCEDEPTSKAEANGKSDAAIKHRKSSPPDKVPEKKKDGTPVPRVPKTCTDATSLFISPPDVVSETDGRIYVVADEAGDDDDDKAPREAVVDQPILDAQGNPGTYTGIVLKESGQPSGVGRLVYADGKRIHEGFWRNGRKEGHGRCLFFPQGDFHEGEYKNNIRHGPGRYQWKDGRRFDGTYKDDLRDGHGVFTYPTGERYEGMFHAGRRSGHGRFSFDNGRGLYDGEWMSGKYHGKGHLVWGSGFSYEGSFANGAFEGAGIKKDPTGKVVEHGVWEKGDFQPESSDDNLATEAMKELEFDAKGTSESNPWKGEPSDRTSEE